MASRTQGGLAKCRPAWLNTCRPPTAGRRVAGGQMGLFGGRGTNVRAKGRLAGTPARMPAKGFDPLFRGEALEPRFLFAVGSVDPTFGQNGQVTVQFTGGA